MTVRSSTPYGGFTLIEALIVLAIIAILASVPVLGSVRCTAQWERSGMASSWGLIQGCMVEVEPGRWIPQERLREIDLPRKK
jgi:prepilin-type N-terminal cleavage/methylation domain-containing protein